MFQEEKHARLRALKRWQHELCPACRYPPPGARGNVPPSREARLWLDGRTLVCRWGHRFEDAAALGEASRPSASRLVVI